jgi:hypothetical protein
VNAHVAPPKPGLYRASAGMRWNSTPAERELSIVDSCAGTVAADRRPATAGAVAFNVSTLVKVAQGCTLSVHVWLHREEGFSTPVVTDGASFFDVQYVGPAS